MKLNTQHNECHIISTQQMFAIIIEGTEQP